MYAATSPEAATLTSADADASVLPVAAVETVPLAQADPHAGAAEHGTATAEHGAEHGSGGLPQLDTQHWGGQIIWLAIIFVGDKMLDSAAEVKSQSAHFTVVASQQRHHFLRLGAIGKRGEPPQVEKHSCDFSPLAAKRIAIITVEN